MSAPTCSRKGCARPARWHPKLIVYARCHDARKWHEPAEGVLCLPICDEHTHGVAVAELVSDEGWAKIVRAFRDAGLAEPDRASVTLGWVPIES